MPDKAWKKRERDVANYFNGKRTPLSGGNGKVTRADVIHDDLFIECKLRAKHTAVSLWDDTAKLAKDEGKTPVIALCEKNRPGFWIMVHSDDLKKIKDKELFAYGVYQIEADGRSLFSKIEGDEDAIMGLPIKQIKIYLDR